MNNFRFIESPNLPDSRVTHAVASPQYPLVISALNKLGIAVLEISACKEVLHPLRNHADMLFSYLGNGCFAAEHGQTTLSDTLTSMGMNRVNTDISLTAEYPRDIPLNFFVIGRYIICKAEATPDIFKAGRTVIDVKQGYAGCSCVPVDGNSLITDDPSVYKSALAYGLDTLLVNKGGVRLDGFDTGFIGGCSFKLAGDILAFCGDIGTHPDHNSIRDFLKRKSIRTLSLFDGELIDIGSVIPVAQACNCI